MLSASDVKKSEREVLASALSKGCFELKQAPSLHIPATAAVWALSSAEGASKGKSGLLTGNADAVQPMVQGAMQDMGISLFAAFDLALAVGPSSVITESYMDSLIDRQANGHAASSQVPWQIDSVCSSSSSASRKLGVDRQQLRQQIGRAASLPLPCISPGAVMMIQHYYALLRQQSQTQGSAAAVGTHTVASLVRMATASARLHMRNDAMAMPDAVLAIYMLQKSLKAKVCLSHSELLCSRVLLSHDDVQLSAYGVTGAA